MQKQAIFQSKLLPYALVAPQLAIVLIFFYWPALQAVIQSFLLQDLELASFLQPKHWQKKCCQS